LKSLPATYKKVIDGSTTINARSDSSLMACDFIEYEVEFWADKLGERKRAKIKI
jgi:hypothetical protein